MRKRRNLEEAIRESLIKGEDNFQEPFKKLGIFTLGIAILPFDRLCVFLLLYY